jgi:coenzyme PQQ precursor peptide PqqA
VLRKELKHGRRNNMTAWTKPIIAEISVGLEINSYACAEK